MIGAASALSPSLSIAAIRGVKPIQQRGPWVRREESWIQCKLDEPLRPDHEEFAGKIWIAIKPEFPDEDLRIPYVLYAAATSKPVKGTVIIKLRHRHEAWSPPELPSRDAPAMPPITRTDQHERYLQAHLDF